MPVKKQSGVGFLPPGSYLVFKTMNCSLWTCPKSLMPCSIQFINNYKFLLRPLPGPFLLFFLSPTGCHVLLQRVSQPRDGTLCLLCLLHWQVDSLLFAPPGKPSETVVVNLNFWIALGYTQILNSHLCNPCHLITVRTAKERVSDSVQ